MTGRIKLLVPDKGFGFIVSEDGTRYFVHCNAFRNHGAFEQLREGQSVTFDGAKSDKGPRAENVRLVS